MLEVFNQTSKYIQNLPRGLFQLLFNCRKRIPIKKHCLKRIPISGGETIPSPQHWTVKLISTNEQVSTLLVRKNFWWKESETGHTRERKGGMEEKTWWGCKEWWEERERRAHILTKGTGLIGTAGQSEGRKNCFSSNPGEKAAPKIDSETNFNPLMTKRCISTSI